MTRMRSALVSPICRMATRLPVAAPRLRRRGDTVDQMTRVVLDAIERALDAGPRRKRTIEAVNTFAAALLIGARYRLAITTPTHPEVGPVRTGLVMHRGRAVGDTRHHRITLGGRALVSGSI